MNALMLASAAKVPAMVVLAAGIVILCVALVPILRGFANPGAEVARDPNHTRPSRLGEVIAVVILAGVVVAGLAGGSR